MKTKIVLPILLLGVSVLASCKKDKETVVDPSTTATVYDPLTAPKQSIDRFSATAGTLQVRDANNGLPEANVAVNFDQGPFITKGIGPTGQLVEYYNFDVQSTTPAPIYVLFKAGETTPVSGQLNIIDVIPGDATYNDFWQVVKVTVPSSYVANTIASYQGLLAAGYAMEPTTTLVNCPVVPEGSTAVKRVGNGSAGLFKGWYQNKVVFYFTFEEKMLMTASNLVPLSPIFVTFNINPNLAGGGPASGFMTEVNSTQTHNVIATIPVDAAYSPLWYVNVYDNTDFSSVSNLTSANSATILATGVATVNCPVVAVQ